MSNMVHFAINWSFLQVVNFVENILNNLMLLQITITMGSKKERESGGQQLSSMVNKILGWQVELEETTKNFCFSVCLSLHNFSFAAPYLCALSLGYYLWFLNINPSVQKILKAYMVDCLFLWVLMLGSNNATNGVMCIQYITLQLEIY